MNSSLVPTTRWSWMQSLASILSLLICVCFPAVSSAQSLTLGQEPAARDQAEQISEYVREVFQDRDGNFWFGTNGDGAWRYDGKSLRNFTAADGLTSKGINAIYTDSRGDLWLGGNGVFKFNGESFDRIH